MKILLKLSFIPAAVFLFSSLSHAQFYLGAKGGITIPNLTAGGSNPVSDGWSSRLGPYFGVVTEQELGKTISLQAELNYASEGGKKNGEQAIPNPFGSNPQYFYANYKSVIKLNYLELPLMLRFNFHLNKSLAFFIGGGPYAAYIVSAKLIGSGNSAVYTDKDETMPLISNQSFDSTENIKDQVKKFNAGIQGSIGFALNTVAGKLVLSAGGNYGLINIQSNEVYGKNNTGAATITLSYLFKL